MNAPQQSGGSSQFFTVTNLDRGRNGHNALHSMAGPEFTGVGAVFAPLNVLPLTARLVVLGALIAVGMVGCTAAWIDYQDYTPSPNICRAAGSGVPPEPAGSCVPRQQTSGVMPR